LGTLQKSRNRKANLQYAQQSVEQDKLTFQQEIYTQVTLFEMLQKQVNLTKETDDIATNRYQIAQDRFILSDLNITDLGIAEKKTVPKETIFRL
jgi:outer membrane protein TolC